jgi:hypothetical protein
VRGSMEQLGVMRVERGRTIPSRSKVARHWEAQDQRFLFLQAVNRERGSNLAMKGCSPPPSTARASMPVNPIGLTMRYGQTITSVLTLLVSCQIDQKNVDPNSSPEFYQAHQFCKSIGVDDTRDPDGTVNARMGQCMIDNWDRGKT